MTQPETVDAEFSVTGTALATRATAAVATWVPTFAVAVDEAVERVEAKRDFFRRVMREGEHYGKIPGTGDNAKPALLKPGAELLLSNMGLRIELTDADAPTIDYGDESHEGLIRYRRVCRVYRQTGPQVTDREIVAQAEGSCSSRETKYRYRDSKRKCPKCNVPAIIVGKAEYGGGYVCFKKQGGCGAKFSNGDPAIEGQATGRITNPDLADVENTILKMGDKRALVAATLLATGCSDIFTQDIEDFASDPVPHEDSPAHAERATRPAVTPSGHSDEPVTRSANDPGSITEASVKALTRAYALLGLNDLAISLYLKDVSGSRVGGGGCTNQLSENEARRLGKALKAELDAKKESVCELCTGQPGEPHLWADGEPCPHDQSEEAVKWAADRDIASGLR